MKNYLSVGVLSLVLITLAGCTHQASNPTTPPVQVTPIEAVEELGDIMLPEGDEAMVKVATEETVESVETLPEEDIATDSTELEIESLPVEIETTTETTTTAIEVLPVEDVSTDDLTAETQPAGEVFPTEINNGELIGGDAVATEVTPGEVSFTIFGGNFYFDMTEIRVKKGDKVTIDFRSQSGFHDWVVDEFDAATAQVKTGNSSSVTFIADKTGTFEYYCSVGSHRANGMVGQLIVE